MLIELGMEESHFRSAQDVEAAPLKPLISFRRPGVKNSIEQNLSGFEKIHFQPVDNAMSFSKQLTIPTGAAY